MSQEPKMLTSNGKGAITVQVTESIRSRPVQPEEFKATDKFLYCVAGNDVNLKIAMAGDADHNHALSPVASAVFGNDALSARFDEAVHITPRKLMPLYKLSKADQQLLEQSVAEQALQDTGIRRVIKITKSRFLIPERSNVKNSSEIQKDARLDTPATSSLPADIKSLAYSNYSAFVITWHGRGPAPAELTLESSNVDLGECRGPPRLSRIQNSQEARGECGLRWHWTRIELHDSTKKYGTSDALQHVWNDLADRTGSDEFNIHHVPMKVHNKIITLSDAIDNVRGLAKTDLIGANLYYDVVKALLRSAHGDFEDMIVHGHKFFNLGKTEDCTQVLGLTHCTGQALTVKSSGDSGSAIRSTEELCPRYFFSPGTVANFMLEYFGGSNQFQQAMPVEQFNQSLRGKNVSIQLDGDKSIRAIAFVSNVVPANVLEDQKHPVWQSKSKLALTYAGLPCINVGSKYKYALLPPELCTILPGQSFTGPITKQVTNVMALLRPTMAEKSSAKVSERLSYVTTLPDLQQPKLTIGELIGNSALKNPTVLFVEAGVEPMKPCLWGHFQKSLYTVFADSFEVTVDPIDSLFLRFRSGEGIEKEWINQLTKFRAQKAAGKQNVIAVVAIQEDAHKTSIYKIIKSICELDVGIQTFFYNLKTLQDKVQKHPKDGMKMAAHEILRRAVIRNPITSLSNGIEDIAVAVHIAQFEMSTRTVGVDGRLISGSLTLYLVVLVSRQAEQSAGYKTWMKLVDSDEVKELPLDECIADFVQKLTLTAGGHRCHINILRSGIMPETANLRSKFGGVSKDQMFTRSMFRSTDMQDPAVYSGAVLQNGAKETTLPLTQHELVSGEVESFGKAIRHALHSKNMSTYVAYVLPSETKASSAEEPSFFAFDAHKKAASIDNHRQVHIERDGGVVVSLDLYGDKLCEGENDQVHKTLGMMHDDQTSSTSPGSAISPVAGAARVHENELRRLEHLWTDNQLGLHGTKWPIPTHLAMMAAKRARLHIAPFITTTKDGGIPKSKDNNNPRFMLREVHEDVRDSLYFL